jgi:Fe2+ transport system protein FeoA
MESTAACAAQPPSSLDALAAGARGLVQAVRGEGHVRRRLLEMGVCRGVSVEVVRRAPFGDPIELRVRGYSLSLRAEQAALVLVTPER